MNVTVVIPALNAGATLNEQLAALDAQHDGPRFGVIVVDNGSTDDTARVAATFPAKRFEVTVVHEQVRGINSARNAGAAAAPDGLLLFCDADDQVHAGWVAALSAAIPADGWVGGRLDYARLNSARTRSVWGAPALSTFVETAPFTDNTFGGNCGFWRAMWEEVGGFDLRLSGGGDETEFFMRAAAAGFRCVDVPGAVVSYRLRPGVRAMVRQRYRQGTSHVVLRTLPGGLLLPGSLSRADARAAVLRRIVVAPKYLWSTSSRCQWAASVATYLGQLAGFRRIGKPSTTR